MNLSIVIPLLNEEESLKELYDCIMTVIKSNHFLYEIIFIDDGSTDNSWEIIKLPHLESKFLLEKRFTNLYCRN